jgi:hypothetical protein
MSLFLYVQRNALLTPAATTQPPQDKRDGNQEPKDIVHYLTIFLICLPKQVATTTATFRFDPTRTILSRFSFSISWFQFQQ